MIKNTNPDDNRANQQGPNKGFSGTNRQYDQSQGNRGKQTNSSQHQRGRGTKGGKK